MAKDTISGKLYKALAGCCVTPKQGRRVLEKPWYSPDLRAIVATNTYELVAIDLESTETAPCVFNGDTSRVLAKDEIGFDTPIDREPIAPNSVRECLESLNARGSDLYNPELLEKIFKVAKSAGWFVCFSGKPEEILRGYFYSPSERDYKGRWTVYPARR